MSIPRSVMLAALIAVAAAIGAVGGGGRAEGDGNGQQEEPDVISLAQYNIQFLLPSFVPDALLDQQNHFPPTTERAEQIARAVACEDIVALQETSRNARREDVFNFMEAFAADCPDGRAPLVPDGHGGTRFFDFSDGPDNSQIDPILDDEVSIASRFPIIEVHTTVFDDCSSLDCLADKGVIHARVWRGAGHPASDSLDVFVTHLDQETSAQTGQLAQLAAFALAHNDPTTPAVIMGDFNISGNPEHAQNANSEYSQMMATLSASFDGGLVDLGLGLKNGATRFTNPGQSSKIDYILVSGADTALGRTDCFGSFNTPSLAADIFDFVENSVSHDGISDHCAVLGDLKWAQVPTVANPAVKLPKILRVEVSRLEEVTPDVPALVPGPILILTIPTPFGPVTFFIPTFIGCDGLTDHFGNLKLTANGLQAEKGFTEDETIEGDDVSPVPRWDARLAIPAGIPEGAARFDLEDDDDALCGGTNDTQDVNPFSDDFGVSLAANFADDQVFVATEDGRTRIAAVGEAVVLEGTDEDDRARVTLIVESQYVNEADLEIQKFCKPDEVAGPGQPFTCTILVENRGPGLAKDVVIRDVLITDVPVDQYTVSTNAKECDVPEASNQFRCELGTLVPGSLVKIIVTITSNVGGQFNNHVGIMNSATPDPDASNNKAVANAITVRTCKLGVSHTELVPPVISPVTISPERGQEGKPVFFIAAATDNCNSPGELHYKWTFSDGGVGFRSVTQHTFADNGFYTGTVHVSDKAGNEAQRGFSVDIDNQLPVISPLPPVKAPWGVPIEFSAQAVDPGEADKENLRYHWDFGVPGTDTDQALNPKVTFAYPEPGNYTVTLTVSDDKESSVATGQVTINKRPTTIKNCGETQVEESAHKVPLCGRLLVADIDGGDADAGVKDKTLSFSLAEDKFVSGDTDANGETRPSVNIVLSRGCIPGSIVFAGDALYEPFTYNYVFYTTGGGRPGDPAGQVCELSTSGAGFQLLDSDADGCSNGQEAGADERWGGLRDSNSSSDFFDTPVGEDSRRDKIVTAGDIFEVVSRFGALGDPSTSLFAGPIPAAPAYHPAYDRTPGDTPWLPGPPDGKIAAEDIALVVAQFGHTCA